MTEKPKNTGRPSIISDTITTEICDRIEDGESLRKICKSDHMPTADCVRKWLAKGDMGNEKYKPFVLQYARARESQADTLADEITEIADTEPDPNKARVRVDARKWVAAKLRPRKYGDFTQHQVSGRVDVVQGISDNLRAVLDTAYNRPQLPEPAEPVLIPVSAPKPQDVDLAAYEIDDNMPQ